MFCNQCFNKNNGDGVAAIGWRLGLGFQEALAWVADQLGLADGSSDESVDMVDAVAAAKGVRPESLRLFGAHNAMRGKAPVCRVPMFDKHLDRVGEFDIGTGNLSKGLTGKGQRLGLLLPHDHAGEPFAPTPAESWCVVEGVKDAAALTELGYNTIGLPGTNPGPLASRALKRHLERVDVTLVPDLDEAGQKTALHLVESLEGAASSIRVVKLPGEVTEGNGRDVRDVRRTEGDEAVRAAIDAEPAEQSAEATPPVRRWVARSYAEIKPARIDWFWSGVFPSNSLALVAGNAGEGKSLVLCKLAAVVTTGAPWPGHFARRPAGWVIFITFEDEPDCVIRPRLDAAGADPRRVIDLRLQGGSAAACTSSKASPSP